MTSATTPTPAASNFLLNIVQDDLDANRYAGKRWAGKPGPAAQQQQGGLDPARIRTRFPPEPNGYLHIGHAKSICVNFGLARDFGGVCHLRFDDTNPEKEDQEYVDAIIEAVHWLGFDWKADGRDNLYFASDYFGYMYEFAEALVEGGLAAAMSTAGRATCGAAAVRRLVAQEDEPLTDLLDRLDVADLRAIAKRRTPKAAGTEKPGVAN